MPNLAPVETKGLQCGSESDAILDLSRDNGNKSDAILDLSRGCGNKPDAILDQIIVIVSQSSIAILS